MCVEGQDQYLTLQYSIRLIITTIVKSRDYSLVAYKLVLGTCSYITIYPRYLLEIEELFEKW